MAAVLPWPRRKRTALVSQDRVHFQGEDMHKHLPAWAALAWLLVAGLPGVAGAQEISGFVKDATGGVLPGATVTATQVGTQLTRTTVTNDQGYYVLPEVPIGEYEVVVELQGFKRFIE